ncbi:MAG: hypothetical protein OHK0048_07750 [Rhodoferax sp.]
MQTQPSPQAIDIFPWDDHFNTGIADIDQQHRKLVELLNILASHVAFESAPKQLAQVFDDLVDYTVYHFQTEEAIWQRHFAGDADEQAHRDAHARFVTKVTALKAAQGQRPLAELAEEALDFLARWLASHILETDRVMAYTVQAMQQGMALAPAKRFAQSRMDTNTRTLIDLILNIYGKLSSNTVRLMRELVQRREIEQRLSESEANLQALFNSLREFVVVIDAQGNLLDVNDYVVERLGYDREALIGQSALKLHPPNCRDESQAFLQEMLAGQRAVCPVPFMARDGTEIPVETRVVLGPWNGQQALFGLSRDISERLAAERDLQNARKAAEVASEAKSRFLATMSHEIRTPMNGILGMAQLLLQPGLSAAERDHYTRTLLSSGQTLQRLLDDILDLSRIEAGKLTLESRAFSPLALMHEVQSLFSSAAQAKGLQLTVQWQGEAPPPVALLGDALRLRQMLSNLVGNAIKFTAQGFVRIEGRIVPPQGEQGPWLEWAVVDSGIGVAPEVLPLLFHPFTQADSSTTRQFGGSGLGLSIVRHLAQAMGGQVGVDSTLGQGSRFAFRVPAVSADATGGQEAKSPTQPGAPHDAQGRLQGRVLVAEDNPVNSLVIQALLKQLGLDARVVGDGQQALDHLRDEGRDGWHAEVVLMDVHMPVMDGYSATRAIRAHEAAQGLPRRPIIALTADAFEEDRQRCLAAGMDDFLTKPIALAALQQALKRWLPALP